MNEHTSARSFDQAISRAIGAIEAWAAPKLSQWRQVKTDLMSAWERLASGPNEEGFRTVAATLRQHGLDVALSRWTPSEDDLFDPRTRPWARCRLALQEAMAGQFDQAVMFASDIDPLEWSLLMELAPLRLVEAWFGEHATEWAAALFDICDVERVAKIAGSGWLSEDAKFLIASVRPHFPMAESGQQPAEPATTQLSVVGEPILLLRGWRDIVEILRLAETMPKATYSERRRRLAYLNRAYGGPIQIGKRGSQPVVDRSALLAWWQSLTTQAEGKMTRDRDLQATVAATHLYGRTGIVVPDLGGSIRRRKGKG